MVSPVHYVPNVQEHKESLLYCIIDPSPNLRDRQHGIEYRASEDDGELYNKTVDSAEIVSEKTR